MSWLDQIAMYHDILPFVSFLAISNADIGCVHGYQFELKLKVDRPFAAKVIKYKPEERLWLKAYLDELIKLGIVIKFESEYCSNVVLVREGQTD